MGEQKEGEGERKGGIEGRKNSYSILFCRFDSFKKKLKVVNDLQPFNNQDISYKLQLLTSLLASKAPYSGYS